MVPRCPGENHYPNGAELTPLKGYNRAWKWCILTRLALSRGRLVERTDRGETPEIQGEVEEVHEGPKPAAEFRGKEAAKRS
jgi:hypothetical protein